MLNMYRAVFIDMDGTLLKADHSISEETRAAIHVLRDNGILVALVSARPYHGIMETHAWLGIGEFPVASLNGSYITSLEEVLFSATIPSENLPKLQQMASSYNTSLLYYSGMQWFAEQESWATDKEAKITDVPVRTGSFDQLQQIWEKEEVGMNKLMAVGAPDDIQKLQAEIRLSIDTVAAYTSKPTYLEIMPLNASKALAIKYLCEMYNIPLSESIALGDNYNDVEMLKVAGKGIAMGNAPDDIKAIADAVTDTNQNDGVRKALEENFPQYFS